MTEKQEHVYPVIRRCGNCKWWKTVCLTGKLNCKDWEWEYDRR